MAQAPLFPEPMALLVPAISVCRGRTDWREDSRGPAVVFRTIMAEQRVQNLARGQVARFFDGESRCHGLDPLSLQVAR